MSSLEKQSYSEEGSKADRLDPLDTVYFRANIERLMTEARDLGKLMDADPSELELNVDITDEETICFNDLGTRVHTRERASFYVILDQDVIGYRVRHNVSACVDYDNTQELTREYWLIFNYTDTQDPNLNLAFSCYNAQLNPNKEPSDYLSSLDIVGAEIFKLSEYDATRIKGFQLEEISGLAKRALDSIRADA